MYIRKFNRLLKRTGETRSYLALVEGERVGNTIRQRILLHLDSSFDLPQEKWPMFCKKVQRSISGERVLFETSFNQEYEILVKTVADKIIEKRAEKNSQRRADTGSILVHDEDEVNFENFRTVGPEHVALYGAKLLGLFEIFKASGLSENKANLALAAVVSRMVHPSSELETCRWINNNSALSELIDIDIGSEKNLYKISDELYDNKEQIEKSMALNIYNLFNQKPTISFYDLTNTFFESSRNDGKLKRGHSKEKRSDCPLITLAVVIDACGFIIRSEVFAGNISEPSTLETILNKLAIKTVGKIVMDRGIATAKNIQWLTEKGYLYLVVNRQQKREFDFEKAVTITTKSKAEVKIYKEMSEDCKEIILHCYSENKNLKESSIWARKAKLFEEALININDGLTKPHGQKGKSVIDRRIGRLFEKCKGISQHYSVKVEDNSLTKTIKEPLLATKITWEKNPINGSMMDKPGVYSLRTNDINMATNDIWHTYSQLTDIEAVFKSLKSELGLRPIFHQKEQRIEGHLFITVLAYQCVQIIRNILKSANIYDSWESIRNCLSSHGRATMVLPKGSGIYRLIRKTGIPDESHQIIYRALRITNYPGEVLKRSERRNSYNSGS